MEVDMSNGINDLEMKRLYENGFSTPQIAQMLNSTKGIIYYRLKKIGVQIRNYHQINIKEKNGNWKGNNTTGDIARYRAVRWYKLEKCGNCNEEAIDRHHIDGNLYNNERSNIKMLCRRCHMIIDGRFEKLINTAKSQSKITYKEVIEIRELKKIGKTNRELSIQYGVSRPTISKIYLRQRRADI